MSEILNECDAHPHEDRSFTSAVLKALMGRQALQLLYPLASEQKAPVPTEFITALGVDVVWSELVNDCANRITHGACSKYVVQTNGFNVNITPKKYHE